MYKHAVFLCILCYFIVQDAGAEDLEFVILHNNDMHARFEEYDNPYSNQKVGGMGRTAYVIKQARKAAESGEGPPVLYLNGGDTFTGTVWYAVHKWKIVADFMNLLKPDAATLGNHEFDQGTSGVVHFIQAANFPIVCANIDSSYEPTMAQSKLKRSVVVDVKGTKVGIIGYITKLTQFTSLAMNVKFTDEIQELRIESTRLNKQGVKIIIALGHSGFEKDKLIASKVPLVDIVVGAHSHTLLWTGDHPDKEEPFGEYPLVITQPDGKQVPIVTAYAYTKYIGKLTVRFDETGALVDYSGQPILLDKDTPEDEEAIQLLETFRKEINKLTEVVGQTDVFLVGRDEQRTCRIEECNYGNLISDAFVFSAALVDDGPGWAVTPIGLFNAGALRGVGIEPGDITRADLLETLPYVQPITLCTLNGSDLLKTLEHSVHSNGDTSRGEFLQVSGLRVVYDLKSIPYHRVVSVEVRCGACTIPQYFPLEISVNYNIVVNFFLGHGGDGHETLRKSCFGQNVINYTDYDALTAYIETLKLVSPKVEGRIAYASSSRPDASTILVFSVALSYLIVQNVAAVTEM